MKQREVRDGCKRHTVEREGENNLPEQMRLAGIAEGQEKAKQRRLGDNAKS